MPNYTFKNKNTEEIKTLTMSISEREEFIKENPDFIQVFSPTQYVSADKIGLVRPSSHFRDRLKDIHKNHKYSQVNTWG